METENFNKVTKPQEHDSCDCNLNDANISSTKKNRGVIYKSFFKRFFDIIISGIALIILSPLFLILAIIVRIKLGAPVIFCQLRPGKNGKVFKFYKFRSMTNARDEKGELLPDKLRITKFGRILRKSSLDELPQLWNIFIGDMSIIGPRPKLVKDMVFFDCEAMKGYAVRPGLTGLAQVSGRNDISWQATFDYNVHYVENNTFGMDLKIFFKTFTSIFSQKGASGGASEKEEYYYADHLLKNKKITKEEYEDGLNDAKQIKALDIIKIKEKR